MRAWPKAFRAVHLIAAAAVMTAACARAPEDADRHSPNPRIRILLTRSTEPVLALATGDTVHMGDEMKAFYKKRFYRAAWTSRKGILPRGQTLVAALRAADEEGLDPAYYHGENVHALIEQAKADLDQDLPVGDLLGNLDLLLTESFLRYATDIRRGTIDPSAEGLDWKVPQEDDTNTGFLIALLKDDDFEKALAGLRPDVPFYNGLREGLVRYRKVADAGGWPSVAEAPPLEEGDRGARVAQLRARLVAEGDPVEAPLAEGAAAPDVYDTRLAEAVEHFQDRHGLADDGAAGEGTLVAMNVPVEDRLRSIRLNLDRWRWLPREFGNHYIMVNVAGFEMAVMKDDQKVLGMRVVVGKTGNETPIFRDTLENIVVNPYWNVPTSIAREEILPAIARDPGYLAKNNMEMVGGGATRWARSSSSSPTSTTCTCTTRPPARSSAGPAARSATAASGSRSRATWRTIYSRTRPG